MCIFRYFKELDQESLFLLHTIQPDTSPNPGIQFSGKFFAERADAQLSCQLHWTQLRGLTSPGSRSLVHWTFLSQIFQHDVSNTRFSCVGQSSEVTVCFQSPQGQLQQFPLQKSQPHYFSGAPRYGKMVNLGFPFPQPMFNSWIDSPIKL